MIGKNPGRDGKDITMVYWCTEESPSYLGRVFIIARLEQCLGDLVGHRLFVFLFAYIMTVVSQFDQS